MTLQTLQAKKRPVVSVLLVLQELESLKRVVVLEGLHGKWVL
jgi:hypothetical protein